MADRHPSYGRVFLTFARNSLVRDLSFRTNFLLQSVSSVSWTLMNVGFYLIIFHHTPYDRTWQRLGKVRVLRVSGHDLADQQCGADTVHAQLAAIQRVDPNGQS